MLSHLWKPLCRMPALAACCRTLETGAHCAVTGVHPPLLAALARALQHELHRPVLLVTPAPEDAETLFQDLQTLGGSRVALFAAHGWEHDELLSSEPVNLERMETLSGLSGDTLDVVVAPHLALLQELPAPQDFDRGVLRLRAGASLDMVELLRQLFERGYERTEMIEFRGECSARGGIVDVFPVTAERPVRIEFLGNEICSIRQFDIHSQRARPADELELVGIPPARESAVQAGDDAHGATLLAYFRTPPVIVWQEFRRILGRVQRLQNESDAPAALRTIGPRFDAWLQACQPLPVLYAQELAVDVPDSVADAVAHIETEGLDLAAPVAGECDGYKPHEYALLHFAQRLQAWHARGYAVSIACATDADRDRLRELLTRDAHAAARDFHICTAPLSGGWIVPAAQHVAVTDDEIFRRMYTRRRRARRLRTGRAVPIENIASIAPGEYVVHVNHGIGQFEGIRAIELDGARREMIIVRYADNALLYVPLEQAHLIERYVSVGQGAPLLDTLGSGHWAARTRRAARAVLDLAAELLERQAQRAAQPGMAFAPDADWQLSFEKAFPYAETPDQARAIEEVKRDMQAARPMDRLICGDVGFGKTEVALRAAFKAVMSGKQVAVLVPTTILAQQHWHTFSERVAGYPVRVDVLSRFVHARDQKRVITALAAGEVDIIIGTHRLLARDVAFRDLGLIVVDEEQRFGVRHKEALKKLRALVDVLTLSATPIPRTLYASLTGARDMSTIHTPPEERMPVTTQLIKRDYRVIREAILRELARGGQVFFLHNRVETIGRTCDLLQQLVPHARFTIGHGQMHEDDLARTMEEFNARRYDVLVCTMIIEAGLDLPNVNTIIVDNAHTFGLADLYQLRGRVGRSSRQAYAYLIIPSDLVVDGAARHRLKAILEHTALGSGYAIAMRDLEIRGAGNLLGPQQSGHIAAVGFSLYCKLLQRAVDILKKDGGTRLHAAQQETAQAEPGAMPPRVDWRKELPALQPRAHGVEIRLPFSGNIPAAYVESAALRLDLFRRAGLAERPGHLRALEDEMRDRFGPLPAEALVLLRIAEARLHALARGIDCIEAIDGKVVYRRRGSIMNAGNQLPRIAALPPLQAMDVVLANLERIQAVGA